MNIMMHTLTIYKDDFLKMLINGRTSLDIIRIQMQCDVTAYKLCAGHLGKDGFCLARKTNKGVYRVFMVMEPFKINKTNTSHF